MKSYRNNGQNVYDNTPEPIYNVLSYTWGNFRDNSAGAEDQHVAIQGVDWRIPSILHSHFTPSQFQWAMKRAAQGVQKDPCEWLWVDIACIPQEQEGESDESIRLRMQEIGKQVGIFARAQESFAWLSTLETAQICEPGRRLVRAEALEKYTIPFLSYQMQPRCTPEKAASLLEGLDRESTDYVKWLLLILEEPWFKSLWTLQEMVLRPDAWILFRDGLLEIDKESANLPFPANSLRNVRRTNVITGNNAGKWCLSDFKFEISLLDSLINVHPSLLNGPWDTMRDFETKLRERVGPSRVPTSVTNIHQRLDRTLRLMRQRGMDVLDVSFAHTAYSVANHRRVVNILDNVYGVTQAYGISCKTDPPGTSDEEKLRALEDDFGSQLVSQYPVLSQLFIHTHEPRRSWLVTKGCRVDGWWESYEADKKIINLTEFFRIKNEHTAGPCVEFKGFAWDLEPFIGAASRLLKSDRLGPTTYNGMMLDYHVSSTVLGQPIDYFSSREDMGEAAKRLTHHYSAKGLSSLRVMSLGCSFVDFDPNVHRVGVILAPSWPQNCPPNSEVEPEFWIRIGLMRWIENYGDYAPPKKHAHLPAPHQFECIIK